MSRDLPSCVAVVGLGYYNIKLLRNGGKPGLVVDVTGVLPKEIGARSILYWTL